MIWCAGKVVSTCSAQEKVETAGRHWLSANLVGVAGLQIGRQNLTFNLEEFQHVGALQSAFLSIARVVSRPLAAQMLAELATTDFAHRTVTDFGVSMLVGSCLAIRREE